MRLYDVVVELTCWLHYAGRLALESMSTWSSWYLEGNLK